MTTLFVPDWALNKKIQAPIIKFFFSTNAMRTHVALSYDSKRYGEKLNRLKKGRLLDQPINSLIPAKFQFTSNAYCFEFRWKNTESWQQRERKVCSQNKERAEILSPIYKSKIRWFETRFPSVLGNRTIQNWKYYIFY